MTLCAKISGKPLPLAVWFGQESLGYFLAQTENWINVSDAVKVPEQCSSVVYHSNVFCNYGCPNTLGSMEMHNPHLIQRLHPSPMGLTSDHTSEPTVGDPVREIIGRVKSAALWRARKENKKGITCVAPNGGNQHQEFVGRWC